MPLKDCKSISIIVSSQRITSADLERADVPEEYLNTKYDSKDPAATETINADFDI